MGCRIYPEMVGLLGLPHIPGLPFSRPALLRWLWTSWLLPSAMTRHICALHHFRSFPKCSLHIFQVLVGGNLSDHYHEFHRQCRCAGRNLFWLLDAKDPSAWIVRQTRWKGVNKRQQESQQMSTVFSELSFERLEGSERNNCYQIWQAGGTGCATGQSHIGSHGTTDVTRRHISFSLHFW